MPRMQTIREDPCLGKPMILLSYVSIRAGLVGMCSLMIFISAGPESSQWGCAPCCSSLRRARWGSSGYPWGGKVEARGRVGACGKILTQYVSAGRSMEPQVARWFSRRFQGRICACVSSRPWPPCSVQASLRQWSRKLRRI